MVNRIGDGDLKAGDIVLSRICGPVEGYVIGRLVPREDGGLRFMFLASDFALDAARSKAEKLTPDGNATWFFTDSGK